MENGDEGMEMEMETTGVTVGIGIGGEGSGDDGRRLMVGGPVVTEAESDCAYPNLEYPTLPNVEMEDWQYVMRRSMQEIVPGLFLGPYASAAKSAYQELKRAGITHVVCIREERERKLIRPNFPQDFIYLVVELEDSAVAPIIPHVRNVNPFISTALNNGGKVLVHGSAGISRSVALVIGYIMEAFGITCNEAQRYVQSIRFCGNPNEGFMAQLRDYESIYRATHSLQLPLPNSLPQRSNKRSFEEEESQQNQNQGHC